MDNCPNKCKDKNECELNNLWAEYGKVSANIDALVMQHNQFMQHKAKLADQIAKLVKPQASGPTEEELADWKKAREQELPQASDH